MKNTKTFVEVWLILILTAGVFSLYSRGSEITFFGHLIKKNKMGTYFFEVPDKHQVLLAGICEKKQFKSKLDPGLLARQAEEEQKNRVDTSSQHILVIGDSMAGAAGIEYGLRPYALFNGHIITIAGEPSTSTPVWSEEKRLARLIAEHRPTYIIIALGANELFYKDIASREKYVKDILRQAGNIRTIWIGPPNWRPDTGINDLIKTIIGRDRFFDSRGINIERQADGIHPNVTGSVQWADMIARWIMTECRYKIKLKKPRP